MILGQLNIGERQATYGRLMMGLLYDDDGDDDGIGRDEVITSCRGWDGFVSNNFIHLHWLDLYKNLTIWWIYRIMRTVSFIVDVGYQKETNEISTLQNFLFNQSLNFLFQCNSLATKFIILKCLSCDILKVDVVQKVISKARMKEGEKHLCW